MTAPHSQDHQPPSTSNHDQDGDRPGGQDSSVSGAGTADSTSSSAEESLDESQRQQQQQQQELAQHLSDIMESVVKITGAGLGGTIVGLSLQQRLRDLRVTTPATVAAEARRKRLPRSSSASAAAAAASAASGSASAASRNLPLTWALACTTFVSIVETSRYVSPSTIVMENLGGLGRLVGPTKDPETATTKSTAQPSRQLPAYVTTVADYSFGGAVAGVASSFGRRRRTRGANMIARRGGGGGGGGRPPVIGILTGIGLGFVAGCVQAVVDYGVKFAESRRDFGV